MLYICYTYIYIYIVVFTLQIDMLYHLFIFRHFSHSISTKTCKLSHFTMFINWSITDQRSNGIASNFKCLSILMWASIQTFSFFRLACKCNISSTKRCQCRKVRGRGYFRNSAVTEWPTRPDGQYDGQCKESRVKGDLKKTSQLPNSCPRIGQSAEYLALLKGRSSWLFLLFQLLRWERPPRRTIVASSGQNWP